jgi:hypothetical protein
MTDMTWDCWKDMPEHKRAELRDLSELTPALIGLEGWRVEATFEGFNQPERFIVSRSTGWRPIHIMLKRRDSSGGMGVWSKLTSVRKLYKVR